MKNKQQPSSLSLAILCLLLKERQTGYNLKKTFELTPMGHFSASPGAIYPALKRMEAMGWVEGTVKNPESLRQGRLLSLTESGVSFLKTCFSSTVVKEDIIFHMDQLMLRFAFMTPLVGRDATRLFLTQLIELLDEHVEELHLISGQYANDPVEGVLALQHGIESFETTLSWAKNSLKTLSETNER